MSSSEAPSNALGWPPDAIGPMSDHVSRADIAPTEADSAASKWWIAGLTTIALLAVLGITYSRPPASGLEAGAGALPAVNATLNGIASVFLTLGWFFIRRRRVAAHRACMLTACGVSAAFFVSYLVHHSRVGSVPFAGVGPVRTLYFAILVPHIILAAAIVPLVLLTLYRALTGRFDRHAKIARVTLPIWWFVSVSGVAVYFMLYHL